MTFASKIIKIKDSVDIYQIPVDQNIEKLQFYKINTREKSSIKVAKEFSIFLGLLDGKLCISEVLIKCNLNFDENELSELISYLIANGYATEVNKEIGDVNQPLDFERYVRQINYFDDLIVSRSGMESQINLESKNIVLVGCGAVGSAIAIHLVRSGITKFSLVDYKMVEPSDSQRHLYYRISDSGMPKVDSLSEYLKKINPKCQINTFQKKIVPHTKLDEMIDDSIDFVINSADEPYIGHTTLKLGRFLWPLKIPLYVAGGFDAHSMSTGEFIVNGETPCADCCSNTFKVALKDWTPTYVLNNVKNNNPIIGGSGGLGSQSLFSASIAAMNIIEFLIDAKYMADKKSARGEYLLNRGHMTWIDLSKQENCHFCNAR